MFLLMLQIRLLYTSSFNNISVNNISNSIFNGSNSNSNNDNRITNGDSVIYSVQLSRIVLSIDVETVQSIVVIYLFSLFSMILAH